MSDLRRQLGVEAEAGDAQPVPKKAARKKRKLSAAGRANIIAAVKKRWAELHKQQEQARIAPKAAPKRKAKSAKANPPAKPAKRKAAVKAKSAPRPRAKTAVKKAPESKPAQATAPQQTPPLTEA